MQRRCIRACNRLQRKAVLAEDIGRRAANMGRKLLNEKFPHARRQPPGMACAVIDLNMLPGIMHMGYAYARQAAETPEKMNPARIVLMIVNGIIATIPQYLPETMHKHRKIFSRVAKIEYAG